MNNSVIQPIQVILLLKLLIGIWELVIVMLVYLVKYIIHAFQRLVLEVK